MMLGFIPCFIAIVLTPLTDSLLLAFILLVKFIHSCSMTSFSVVLCTLARICPILTFFFVHAPLSIVWLFPHVLRIKVFFFIRVLVALVFFVVIFLTATFSTVMFFLPCVFFLLEFFSKSVVCARNQDQWFAFSVRFCIVPWPTGLPSKGQSMRWFRGEWFEVIHRFNGFIFRSRRVVYLLRFWMIK